MITNIFYEYREKLQICRIMPTLQYPNCQDIYLLHPFIAVLWQLLFIGQFSKLLLCIWLYSKKDKKDCTHMLHKTGKRTYDITIYVFFFLEKITEYTQFIGLTSNLAFHNTCLLNGYMDRDTCHLIGLYNIAKVLIHLYEDWITQILHGVLKL